MGQSLEPTRLWNLDHVWNTFWCSVVHVLGEKGTLPRVSFYWAGSAKGQGCQEKEEFSQSSWGPSGVPRAWYFERSRMWGVTEASEQSSSITCAASLYIYIA